MMSATFSTAQARTSDDLAVQAVSDTVWRVRDSRLPEHDALCVLGVIEKKSARAFEALKVGQGFRRRTFPTFEEATQYFTRP
jgi:hypothetical protein